MGKAEEEAIEELPSACCIANSTLHKKLRWRWIVPIALGVFLLVFVVLAISFHSSSEEEVSATSKSPVAQIQASFWLQRPASVINASLSQLESDLWDEVGVPNTQVVVLSLLPLSSSNWTEVVFGVLPEPSNELLLPADVSVLKETFVELFLEQSVNLSLTGDVFGKAYAFEVDGFPGGITVAPEQSGYPLLKVLVLFNFTLHNTLSYINRNFAELKQQLADGINLTANEILFVQLTNLAGATLESPVIVETSILPVVGRLLPRPRLKQLAQEIIASPRRNLGLNHTLFGMVRRIELSSYLEHSLKPTTEAPSPAPSFSPVPSPSHPPNSLEAAGPMGFRGHMRPIPGYVPYAPSYSPHHEGKAPVYHGPLLSPSHRHHNPAQAPCITPAPNPSLFIPTSPFSPLTPSLPGSPPPQSQPPYTPLTSYPPVAVTQSQPPYPPLTSSPPIAAPHKGESHTSSPQSPFDPAPLVEPPLLSPALSEGPVAPGSPPVSPSSGAAPSIPETVFVPTVGPTSSALVLAFPLWALVFSLAMVVVFWDD